MKTQPLALTWGQLILATSLAWWVGDAGLDQYFSKAQVVIVLISFIKIWLVGMQFMELHSAPRLVVAAFSLWVAGTCLAVNVILFG